MNIDPNCLEYDKIKKALGLTQGKESKIPLERINVNKVNEIIQQAVKDFPEIVGVYLFGSALSYCRPDSDIDIAIFVNPELTLDEYALTLLEGKIALRLPPFKGHSFDLTIVNPGNTIFAFRIIKEGLLLYTGYQDKLYDVIEKISRNYAENAPRHEMAIREILGEDLYDDYRS